MSMPKPQRCLSLAPVLLVAGLIGGCGSLPSATPDSTLVAVAEEPLPEGARYHPVVQDMEGWTVHIEPSLLPGGEHAEEGERALKMLANHLQRIVILLPEKQLKEMQGLEIWIEHQHPELSAMQYHPSSRWLRGQGYDPRLAKKVHIPRAAALYSRGQMLKHPAVILHELAHAYHDQVLGFNDERIIAGYRNAMEKKLYDKVLLYSGQQVRHYATTNEKEYFSEMTETYFYRNDFYPFVRAELKLHDPASHDLMEEIWGRLR